MVEALDWQEQQFGFDRLRELIRTLPAGLTAEKAIDALFRELEKYSEGRPAGDDVTFLVLSFSGFNCSKEN